MKIRKLIFVLLLHCLAGNHWCTAQETPDAGLAAAGKLTRQYIRSVDSKAATVSAQIDKQTDRYLASLEKQEIKLKNKLARVDSLAASNIFAHSARQYQAIRNKIKSGSQQLLKGTGQYLPWLDSAGTSLKFLSANPLISQVNGNAAKISGAAGKVKQLESQFRQAGSVKEFIRQRKEYLSEQLRQYNLGSELKKYNQTAYYYTQQINDYKQVLDDPEKAETKVMALLNRMPAFQQFMKKNGLLAGLFDVPQDYATAGMAGLQTRQQVQNIMQNQIAAMGPNAQQQVQQSLGAAQSELSKLRNQFPSSGGAEDMPDFKPKETKTKSFLKRLEYGTNIQTVKSNLYFPSTTDIALSVGYKISEKNAIGIAGSYKLGWGRDIGHIKLSSQGISLRSYIDIQLKGSFYASGGFEYNYQQPFYTLRELYALQSWQRSGLVGVSKIVSLKTRFFKKTKLQVFWDPLSYSQVPKAQPFKFRVGYSF